MKLSELAEVTFSTIDQGEGDSDIAGAAGLDIAGPGDITFLANPKYTLQIKDTKASAIFLGEGVDVGRGDIAVLRSKDPYLAYTRALRLFHPERGVTGSIHSTAVVHPSAT